MYSKAEILEIFRNSGRFIHPLENLDNLNVDSEDLDAIEIIENLTKKKPNVVLLNLKFSANDINLRLF